MKKLRWQLLVVFLSLAAIGVLLVSQQTPILPGIQQEINEPTSGGIYTEALVGSFGRLNPVLDYYNPADRDVNRLLFSGLMRFDDRGQPQGDLVETWGISQDGTVYNFSIRADANWHDGEPVTSDDIVFTVDMLRNEAIPLPEDLREFWNQVEVIILDDKTIQFRLPEAFAPFMDYLTFGVLPEHLLSGMTAEQMIDAEFNLEPVGSGPYRFDHLIVEEGQIRGVVLTAYEEYYRQPPFIREFVFQYHPDSAAALEAYRLGEVMGISQVTPDVLGEALKEPVLNLYTGRLPRMTLVYLNLDNPELAFFQDPVVRRSLLMATNRQWIVDRLLSGQAIVAHGPILPDTWAYYESLERISFDPEAAIAQLKEAGYTLPAEGGQVRSKDGDRLEFELVHPDQPPYPAIAEEIQRGWQRLGVQVTLKAVPYAELISDYLETRTYDAALVDLNLARSPDPDPYPFWHQAQAKSGQNYASWDDRQASEYLEQARVQVDGSERTKRYRNFQVRFASEMPALPLFYPVYSYAVDSQVQGVQMGPLFDPSERFNTVTSWFLVTRRTTAGDGEAATDEIPAADAPAATEAPATSSP